MTYQAFIQQLPVYQAYGSLIGKRADDQDFIKWSLSSPGESTGRIFFRQLAKIVPNDPHYRVLYTCVAIKTAYVQYKKEKFGSPAGASGWILVMKKLEDS